MANESFQTNSLGWQFQLLQKRLGEWWEWQTSRFTLGETGDLSWLNNPIVVWLLKAIFWTMVIALVLWTVWNLVKFLSPYIHDWIPPWRKSETPRISVPVERSVEDWVQRSQQFQAQNDYHQACLCLYQAMLQQLHNQAIAPKDLSRTDGEYLQILRKLTAQGSYQVLFNMHQQLCFSQEKASSSLLQQCQQAWQDIAIRSQPGL